MEAPGSLQRSRSAPTSRLTPTVPYSSLHGGQSGKSTSGAMLPALRQASPVPEESCFLMVVFMSLMTSQTRLSGLWWGKEPQAARLLRQARTAMGTGFQTIRTSARISLVTRPWTDVRRLRSRGAESRGPTTPRHWPKTRRAHAQRSSKSSMRLGVRFRRGSSNLGFEIQSTTVCQRERPRLHRVPIEAGEAGARLRPHLTAMYCPLVRHSRGPGRDCQKFETRPTRPRDDCRTWRDSAVRWADVPPIPRLSS